MSLTMILHAQNKSWSFFDLFCLSRMPFLIPNPKHSRSSPSASIASIRRYCFQEKSFWRGPLSHTLHREVAEASFFGHHPLESEFQAVKVASVMSQCVSTHLPKRSLVNLKTNRATLKVQLCHGARTVDREMCVLWQSNVHQACQLLKQHHE